MHTVKGTTAGSALVQIWLGAYRHPAAAFARLAHEATPQVGLQAVLLRSLLVVLLGYLPAALNGRAPAEPSYLTTCRPSTTTWRCSSSSRWPSWPSGSCAAR